MTESSVPHLFLIQSSRYIWLWVTQVHDATSWNLQKEKTACTFNYDIYIRKDNILNVADVFM